MANRLFFKGVSWGGVHWCMYNSLKEWKKGRKKERVCERKSPDQVPAKTKTGSLIQLAHEQLLIPA